MVKADLKSGLGNVYPLISDFLNNEPNENFYDHLIDPTFDFMYDEPKVFPHTSKCISTITS